MAERDRFLMTMPEPLGIEKEKTIRFRPAAKKILTEATFSGEAMAMAISLYKYIKGAIYRPDANWHNKITLDPTQESNLYSQCDAQTDYFYVAMTTIKGMVSKTPGVGQTYFGT